MEFCFEKPARENVEGYIKTLNSSQIYLETMGPWEEVVITPEEYGDFIRKELSERKKKNLEHLEWITNFFMGKLHLGKAEKTQTFENYNMFRAAMFEELKRMPGMELEVDLSHYEKNLKDIDNRMKNEKKPYLSKENVRITVHDFSGEKGLLLFTGLKKEDRAIYKIAKNLVFAEKEAKEKKLNGKERRDFLRNRASIDDMTRMRIVIFAPLKSGKYLKPLFRTLKNNFNVTNPHEGYKNEPYPRYKFVLKPPWEEYIPCDNISLHLLGIRGFFEDLFGDSAHPIYRRRFYNKLYTENGVYEFSKEEMKKIEQLAGNAFEFLGLNF